MTFDSAKLTARKPRIFLGIDTTFLLSRIHNLLLLLLLCVLERANFSSSQLLCKSGAGRQTVTKRVLSTPSSYSALVRHPCAVRVSVVKASLKPVLQFVALAANQTKSLSLSSRSCNKTEPSTSDCFRNGTPPDSISLNRSLI